MTKTLIRKYARLIARVGANIKKGQPVIIYADANQYDFVTVLTEECYKAGASKVTYEWSHQPLTKLSYKYRTLESLSVVPKWQEEKLQLMVDELPARISIDSSDPDGLRGIDREKMMKVSKATLPITKKYRDQIENKHQWTIAAVPSYEWAKKVFPNEKKNKAFSMLWDAILGAVYVDKDNDPVEAWSRKNESFRAKSAWLNEQHFEYLTYKSSNGTDFTAWLIPEAEWKGGGDTTRDGHFFNPNLPTEEIFTTPMKGKAEGTLVSTKPLSRNGEIIDNFSITFKDGRAVSWKAEKGEEVLGKLLTMDETAGYIGELALVPDDSAISNSNILFYNTLFDENASCHVAFGMGFPDVIKDYEKLTKEECHKLGVNDSMVHVDFMVGAKDLNITGYKDGKATPIFINGNWA